MNWYHTLYLLPFCLVSTIFCASNDNQQSIPAPTQTVTTTIDIDLALFWAQHVHRQLLKNKHVPTIVDFCVYSIDSGKKSKAIRMHGIFLSRDQRHLTGSFKYDINEQTVRVPRVFKPVTDKDLLETFKQYRKKRPTSDFLSHTAKTETGVITISKLTPQMIILQRSISSDQ